MTPLEGLRASAVACALFPETTLARAVDRLGFVQADPIRSPATAQDLILRHRVKGYRAGDLERRYPSLEIEEDVLYAYGFLPRATHHLLHPRKARRPLSAFERRVLEAVREAGEIHPGDAALGARFGARRVVNAWGGRSKATTSALDALHHRGLLRVARRDGGTRVYAPVSPAPPQPPAERLRKLAFAVARVLAPVSHRTLRAILARYRHLGDPSAAIRDTLDAREVDGVTYHQPRGVPEPAAAPRVVRLLAPFDPLVWDRRRFEHLWGWPYRFEAYTPARERVRGYYAMPLLFGDRVIGWANATASATGLDVEVGFASSPPRARDFRTELDAEIARLEACLRVESPRAPR